MASVLAESFGSGDRADAESPALSKEAGDAGCTLKSISLLGALLLCCGASGKGGSCGRGSDAESAGPVAMLKQVKASKGKIRKCIVIRRAVVGMLPLEG